MAEGMTTTAAAAKRLPLRARTGKIGLHGGGWLSIVGGRLARNTSARTLVAPRSSSCRATAPAGQLHYIIIQYRRRLEIRVRSRNRLGRRETNVRNRTIALRQYRIDILQNCNRPLLNYCILFEIILARPFPPTTISSRSFFLNNCYRVLLVLYYFVKT